MAKLASIIIEKDSREKPNEGWNFEPEEKEAGKVQILGTEIIGIDAGDYRIKGHNDLLIIERKAGFSELFGNLANKEHKERFERELEKFKDIKHKYIIIESVLSKDIMGLSI